MSIPLKDVQRPRSSSPTTVARMPHILAERTINFRLLTWTMILLVVVAPVAYFWHRYQLSRQINHYLEVANEAEKAEDWKRAEAWLRNYLVFLPNDVDARVRLANAIEKGAVSPNERLAAITIYSRLIDDYPGRDDLKTRLADLLLLTDPESALKVIDSVVERNRENTDAEALRVRARILDMIHADREKTQGLQIVIAAYSRAFEKDPSDLYTGFRLAFLYRENSTTLSIDEAVNKKNLELRADTLVDEAVFNNSNRPEAYLARYRYRQAFPKGGVRPKADDLDEDIQTALKLAPENPEARLLAASNLVQVALNDPFSDPDARTRKLDPAKLDAAEKHIRIALDKAPAWSGCHLVRSQIYALRGDEPRAIEALEEGLRVAGPNDPVLNARLAALLMDNDRWREAETVFRRFDDIIPLLRARLAKPSDADRIQSAAKLLEASWYAADKNPERNLVRAAALLKEAIRGTSAMDVSSSANYRLGQLYAALGQFDLAVTAFRAASSANPGALLPILGIADSLRRAGQFNHAVVEYQRLIGLAQRSQTRLNITTLWLDLARAQQGLQSQLPLAKRNWDSFDESVRMAKKSDPNNFLPIVIEVQGIIEKGGEGVSAKIHKVLEENQQRFEKVPGYWQACVESYLQIGDVDSAERSIKEYERSMNGGRAVNLRAKVAIARGQVELARKLLADAGQVLQGEDQIKLLAQRAQVSTDQGNYPEAQALYQELARAQPTNVAWPWELAQIAVKIRDIDLIGQWEKKLRDVEGEDGSLYRFAQVQRLLLQAEYGTRGSLGPAADVARQLVARRPGWPPALTVQGLVAEAQSRLGEASDSYRRAFELGDHEPGLSRKFVGLMVLLSAEPLAWRHLEQLPPETKAHPDLILLAVHVALQQGKTREAIELARLGVAKYPSIGDHHMILGRALRASSDPAEKASAESEFQLAVELSPSDPSAWLALLNYYANGDHPDAAPKGLATLRRASEVVQGSSETLPNSRKAFVIAKAYELMGDLRLADRYYRKAYQENPRDPLLRRMPRSTYFCADLAESQVSLWAGQLRTAADPVRRLLGLMLAGSISEQDQRVGLDLLRDDPRLRGVAWASLGGPENRRQATQFLEQIPKESRKRGDLFLLGRLYRSLDKPDRTREYYSAVAAQGATVNQWAEIADEAIERQAWSEANAACGALVAQQAGADVLTPLWIRIRVGEGKPDEAVRVAEQYAGANGSKGVTAAIAETSGPSRIDRAVTAAGWLVASGEARRATELVRAVAGKEPANWPELAVWLSSRPETAEEGVALARKILERAKDQVAAATLAAQVLIHSGRAKSDASFEPVFQKLLGRQTELPVGFLTSMAILRENQRKPDLAVAITQRALDARRNDVLSLNNMAWFLSAYEGKHQAALDLIDEVVLLLGPVESALDTRGVIELGLKRPASAVRLFETCVDSPNRLPIHYLHLAEAYRATGRMIESKRALEEAKKRGLFSLAPRDQDALAKLGG